MVAGSTRWAWLPFTAGRSFGVAEDTVTDTTLIHIEAHCRERLCALKIQRVPERWTGGRVGAAGQ